MQVSTLGIITAVALANQPSTHMQPHTAHVFCVEATIPCIDVSSLGKQAHSKG